LSTTIDMLNGKDAEQDNERVVGSDRVLAVLVELAAHPTGVSLDELSHQLKSSKLTVHRALTSLRRAGLAAQISRGVYVICDELFRLAFENYYARPDGALVKPVLERLANRYGETVHYAVLDGAEVVYRAKVDPPRGAVRLTSVVGGRNPATVLHDRDNWLRHPLFSLVRAPFRLLNTPLSPAPVKAPG
jgi:IclR family transcriptional regulator, acetate operon repressor